MNSREDKSTPNDGISDEWVYQAIIDAIQEYCVMNEPTKNDAVITRFTSSSIPSMSFSEYLNNIRQYGQREKYENSACFIIAFIYLHRLITKTSLVVNSLTQHRIFLTCMLLATKFHDDRILTNTRYAQIGGLTDIKFKNMEKKGKIERTAYSDEMNYLEIEALYLLDFDLAVSPDEFKNYESYLKSQYEKKYHGVQGVQPVLLSPASSPSTSSSTDGSILSPPSAPLSSSLLPDKIDGLASLSAADSQSGLPDIFAEDLLVPSFSSSSSVFRGLASPPRVDDATGPLLNADSTTELMPLRSVYSPVSLLPINPMVSQSHLAPPIPITLPWIPSPLVSSSLFSHPGSLVPTNQDGRTLEEKYRNPGDLFLFGDEDEGEGKEPSPKKNRATSSQ